MTTGEPEDGTKGLGLAEFLLACIAEDEADAPGWHHLYDCDYNQVGFYGPTACECKLPARVLAECEAKRRIVELHVPERDYDDGVLLINDTPICVACMRPGAHDDGDLYDYELNEAWPCRTLRLLGLPYADHPDFRPEWKV